MKRFRSGNVVRLAGKSGSLVIITGYRSIVSQTWPNNKEFNYEVCDYVYVKFANMSGCSRIDTTTKSELCNCGMVNGRIDRDCEDCNGEGKYMNTELGMDKATLVASTVQSWIIESLTNKFNF